MPEDRAKVLASGTVFVQGIGDTGITQEGRQGDPGLLPSQDQIDAAIKAGIPVSDDLKAQRRRVDVQKWEFQLGGKIPELHGVDTGEQPPIVEVSSPTTSWGTIYTVEGKDFTDKTEATVYADKLAQDRTRTIYRVGDKEFATQEEAQAEAERQNLASASYSYKVGDKTFDTEQEARDYAKTLTVRVWMVGGKDFDNEADAEIYAESLGKAAPPRTVYLVGDKEFDNQADAEAYAKQYNIEHGPRTIWTVEGKEVDTEEEAVAYADELLKQRETRIWTVAGMRFTSQGAAQEYADKLNTQPVSSWRVEDKEFDNEADALAYKAQLEAQRTVVSWTVNGRSFKTQEEADAYAAQLSSPVTYYQVGDVSFDNLADAEAYRDKTNAENAAKSYWKVGDKEFDNEADAKAYQSQYNAEHASKTVYLVEGRQFDNEADAEEYRAKLQESYQPKPLWTVDDKQFDNEADALAYADKFNLEHKAKTIWLVEDKEFDTQEEAQVYADQLTTSRTTYKYEVEGRLFDTQAEANTYAAKLNSSRQPTSYWQVGDKTFDNEADAIAYRDQVNTDRKAQAVSLYSVGDKTFTTEKEARDYAQHLLDTGVTAESLAAMGISVKTLTHYHVGDKEFATAEEADAYLAGQQPSYVVGDRRFASQEEAQEYADQQNKEQGLICDPRTGKFYKQPDIEGFGPTALATFKIGGLDAVKQMEGLRTRTEIKALEKYELGLVQVGQDEEGNPIYDQTYDLVHLASDLHNEGKNSVEIFDYIKGLGFQDKDIKETQIYIEKAGQGHGEINLPPEAPTPRGPPVLRAWNATVAWLRGSSEKAKLEAAQADVVTGTFNYPQTRLQEFEPTVMGVRAPFLSTVIDGISEKHQTGAIGEKTAADVLNDSVFVLTAVVLGALSPVTDKALAEIIPKEAWSDSDAVAAALRKSPYSQFAEPYQRIAESQRALYDASVEVKRLQGLIAQRPSLEAALTKVQPEDESGFYLSSKLREIDKAEKDLPAALRWQQQTRSNLERSVETFNQLGNLPGEGTNLDAAARKAQGIALGGEEPPKPSSIEPLMKTKIDAKELTRFTEDLTKATTEADLDSMQNVLTKQRDALKAQLTTGEDLTVAVKEIQTNLTRIQRRVAVANKDLMKAQAQYPNDPAKWQVLKDNVDDLKSALQNGQNALDAAKAGTLKSEKAMALEQELADVEFQLKQLQNPKVEQTLSDLIKTRKELEDGKYILGKEDKATLEARAKTLESSLRTYLKQEQKGEVTLPNVGFKRGTGATVTVPTEVKPMSPALETELLKGKKPLGIPSGGGGGGGVEPSTSTMTSEQLAKQRGEGEPETRPYEVRTIQSFDLPDEMPMITPASMPEVSVTKVSPSKTTWDKLAQGTQIKVKRIQQPAEKAKIEQKTTPGEEAKAKVQTQTTTDVNIRTSTVPSEGVGIQQRTRPQEQAKVKEQTRPGTRPGVKQVTGSSEKVEVNKLTKPGEDVRVSTEVVPGDEIKLEKGLKPGETMDIKTLTRAQTFTPTVTEKQGKAEVQKFSKPGTQVEVVSRSIPGEKPGISTRSIPGEQTQPQTKTKPSVKVSTKIGISSSTPPVTAKERGTLPHRFRLPTGEKLEEGQFPRVVRWAQGVNDITYDLDTRQYSYSRRSAPHTLTPRQTFRVIQTDTSEPQPHTFKMGVEKVTVTGKSIEFERDYSIGKKEQPKALKPRLFRGRRRF